jgi:HEAT repeat protein
MKNWHKLSLFLAVAVVAGVALGLASHDQEPSYNGRSLSDWLVALTDHSPEGEPEVAEEAIRQIGTNAIPFLVRYSGYTPSLLRLGSTAAISRLGHWLGRDWGEPWNRREARGTGAMEALGILGPAAATAIPELTRLMNSSGDFERARHATFALGHIGRQALPPLMTVLTNPQSPLRGCAALSLSLLGTNALPAVPILIEYLQATTDLALCATTSLGKLQQEPHLVVPALINTLQDSRPEIRCAAARALGQFGDQARPAQPALVNLLSDTDEGTRYAVTNALRAIAPEALTNAVPSVEPK